MSGAIYTVIGKPKWFIARSRHGLGPRRNAMNALGDTIVDIKIEGATKNARTLFRRFLHLCRLRMSSIETQHAPLAACVRTNCSVDRVSQRRSSVRRPSQQHSAKRRSRSTRTKRATYPPKAGRAKTLNELNFLAPRDAAPQKTVITQSCAPNETQ